MPHQKNSMIRSLWAPFLRLLKLLRTHKYFTINISIILALGMALQGWLYHYERYGTQNQVFWVHLGSMYLLSGYSFLVGWGINHWWDCYVSRDSFRYPDLTLIKVVPYDRIILQVLVLQSFWLVTH